MEEQIKGFENGGALDIFDPNTVPGLQQALTLDTDQLRTDVGLPTRAEDELLEALKAVESLGTTTEAETEAQDFDFDKSFLDYQERMKKVLGRPERLSFYDLVSDLGAAMLTTDPTVGPFSAIGSGFATFNERLKKKKADKTALDQQAGLKAFELARADEQAATKYLNTKELERIKAGLRAPKLAKFQYNVVDEQGNITGTKTIDVDLNNPEEVSLARGLPGSMQIETPQNAVTINHGNDKMSELRAKSLIKREDDAYKGFDDAQKMLFDLRQLQAAAASIDYKVGAVEKLTLPFRKAAVSFGFLEDEDIPAQEFIETVNTRLALKLVALTKGPISDREMNTFQASMPGLGATADGLKKQIQYMISLAKYDQKFFEDQQRDTELQKILQNDKLSPGQKTNALNLWEIDWKRKNPTILLFDLDTDKPTGEEFTIGGLYSQYGGAETAKQKEIRQGASAGLEPGVSVSGVEVQDAPGS